MGWSVLEEDLTAAQFLLIYNVPTASSNVVSLTA